MRKHMRRAEVADLRADPATSSPRVCLLTETFYPIVGGGESHARLLAQHLNLLGMETSVITRRSYSDFLRSEDVQGTSTHRVPPTGMKRFGKYAMVPFAFMELLRRRREYDIILVCGFRVLGAPAVIAAALLRKICVLRAEALGEMSGGYASAYRKLPSGIGRAFGAWINIRNAILRHADGFVAISRPVAEEFVECGVDTRRIMELPNGIDGEVFRPVGSSERLALRERLGLPADAMIASYSGKLNCGKGLDYLLRAWADVVRARDDAHLVLIGSGGGQSLSCENELREFVARNEMQSNVTFTGYVENVHEFLQASDIFVFPTENEAFGISLVEAMSCGLPSIASNVGGIPEIVSDGENGILVPPSDPVPLAHQITLLMDADPLVSEPLSENARRTVCERYSIQAVAARYYEMFTMLSGRRGKLLRGWKESDVGETRQELT